MASTSPKTNKNAKHFEFVTLTSQPTTATTRQTSKTVRKQAMNDYLRKQNRQATNGTIETIGTVESTHSEEPSRYKGKFKLDTWSHKTKTKAILARRAKVLNEHGSSVQEEEPSINSPKALTPHSSRHAIPGDSTLSRIFSHRSSLDPFNTFAVKLNSSSDQLLVHCTSHPSPYQCLGLIKSRQYSL